MNDNYCNRFQVDINSGFAPLRQIRAYLGLSRRQMAEKIGVDYDTIWNWESGKSIPKLTWEQVQAFEELLNELDIRFRDIPQLGPPNKAE